MRIRCHGQHYVTVKSYALFQQQGRKHCTLARQLMRQDGRRIPGETGQKKGKGGGVVRI